MQNKDDIWNDVIAALSETDEAEQNAAQKEAYLAFQYYSEMESGGHESFLNWYNEDIKRTGIDQFLAELTAVLIKIGASDYAAIEQTYGERLWRHFKALEQSEDEEEAFYALIEKADSAYWTLDGQLQVQLEEYFIASHKDIMK